MNIYKNMLNVVYVRSRKIKLTNVLALVEGFWNFSRKDGIDSAHDY